MQVGRFDQVRLIREVQCHGDLTQEDLRSSESCSDKVGDTESEAEFVTACAINDQASSEDSELEKKCSKGECNDITQDDEVTTESEGDENEVTEKTSIRKHKCTKKRKVKRKEKSDHLLSTSENSSDSEKEKYTHEEDYSDEEHVYFESMKLKPMITPILPHVHTYVCTMFTPMFTPCSHVC